MSPDPTHRERGRLRVAVLSPSAELGGAERSLVTFMKGAASYNIEATVVLPRDGPLRHELSGLGICCRIVRQPRALLCQSRRLRAESLAMALPLLLQAPGYLWRLAATIRRLRPHVIYTNGVKSHLLASALRPAVRRPIVWHIRALWPDALPRSIATIGADLIVTNSRSTAESLGAGTECQGRIAVVYDGVDTKEFSPEGPVVDLGPVPPAAGKVALPGAFARLKGHDLFLEAASEVRRELPSTRFFLIGGAIYDTAANRGYEAELRRSVAGKGLTDAVVFTGFQRKMAPWYRAMDVVVNASIEPEGFGQTMLEAMSCARAVAGPRAGGIAEFVEHGRNGLLYEMGDADALAEAILTLLRDPALRQRLGAEGRKTATENLPMETFVEGMAQVLRRAAAAGSSAEHAGVGRTRPGRGPREQGGSVWARRTRRRATKLLRSGPASRA
jgi:glycosyltransferase involved in cell wall biosynthesis